MNIIIPSTVCPVRNVIDHADILLDEHFTGQSSGETVPSSASVPSRNSRPLRPSIPPTKIPTLESHREYR